MSSKSQDLYGLPLLEMESKKVRLQIAFQAQLDPTFPDRIAELAHGEKFWSCIQCGTCSATCPVSPYMDYTPRRIIAMIREGFRDDVLRSLTIWLCASCYSCTVECPREIKITDVMYALKRKAIAYGLYPKRFPTPILATEFFNIVQKTGRNSDTRLMANLYCKTNLFKALINLRIGIKLFFSGRLPLGSESVRDRKSLATLLAAVDRAEMEDAS
jgi:heterodisulfide reductase subunit C